MSDTPWYEDAEAAVKLHPMLTHEDFERDMYIASCGGCSLGTKCTLSAGWNCDETAAKDRVRAYVAELEAELTRLRAATAALDYCRDNLIVVTIGHIGSDADNRVCLFRAEGEKVYAPDIVMAAERWRELYE